jgi:type I restriction enzyme S subunit
MQLRELDCEFVSGDTPSRSNPEYYDGDIPWLKTSEVQNNRVASSEEFITEEGLANASTRVVESGAVLVAMYGGGTVGNVGLLEIDAATNQACCAVLTNESELLNEFLSPTSV